MGSEFHGQGFYQPDDAPFGGSVGCPQRATMQAAGRGYVNDATRLLPLHHRYGLLCAKELTVQVDSNGLSPLVGGHRFDRADRAGGSRIRNQDVEPAH